MHSLPIYHVLTSSKCFFSDRWGKFSDFYTNSEFHFRISQVNFYQCETFDELRRLFDRLISFFQTLSENKEIQGLPDSRDQQVFKDQLARWDLLEILGLWVNRV